MDKVQIGDKVRDAITRRVGEVVGFCEENERYAIVQDAKYPVSPTTTFSDAIEQRTDCVYGWTSRFAELEAIK